MTQPDQSELESDIEMLLLRVYNGEYDRSASQTLADVKKRIVSLITANYTPNSRLKALLKESEKWNGRIQGTSNCKSCALQESLAGLIKDKL